MRIVKLLVTVVAMVALGASLCLAAGPVNVSAPEAKALMARTPKLVLVDVRTPEEYSKAHLAGAKLIPLSELETRYREIPKGKPLLVYCAIGARSLQAARFLAGKGYRDVYQISDGLVGWYKNGYPIQKGK